MHDEGIDAPVIAAFKHSYQDLVSGAGGSIREADIRPVQSLLSLEEDIRGKVKADASLLKVIRS